MIRILPHKHLFSARLAMRSCRRGDYSAAPSYVQAIVNDVDPNTYYGGQVLRCKRLLLDADEDCDILVALAELLDFLERWHAPKPDALNRDPDLMR